MSPFKSMQLKTYKLPKMLHLLQLVLILLAFFPRETIAQFQYYSPLHKHTDALLNPLYSLEIGTAYVNQQIVHSNFLIDIDAPVTWHDCVVKEPYYSTCPDGVLCTTAVTCDEYQCTEVRASYSYKEPHCQRIRNTTTPDGRICTCPVNVMDPINGPCIHADLNYDTFYVRTSNGRNPVSGFDSISPNAACANSWYFRSFPASVTGVAAVSSSPYAIPFSIDQQFLIRAFSLCLSSTTDAPGIFFYGSGPYYLLPHSDVDVTSLLSYTPLLKHSDSFGYFIGVNSIVIKKRSIDIPGNTTAKLSTIDPYTTLRTDIYNRLVRRFSLVTKRLAPANPVWPFGVCFSSLSNDTKVNLRVPDIEINVQDGKKWAISTANSMKQVTEDVACLAFVDGGSESEHAIVIGAFQFEDNFVLFDLEDSRFGFSSSLLRKKTSCANFNFTMAS